MNWSDFDNSKVKHDEIKNSNTDKIQEEIIDKPINGAYIVMIHEKSKDDGDDKICEEPYRSFRSCFIYLITSILCVIYFLQRFKYCRRVFHFEPIRGSFGYIKNHLLFGVWYEKSKEVISYKQLA